MAELVIKIPEELEEEIKEIPKEDWSEVALKAIELRAFELKLEKSRKLRHALFKALRGCPTIAFGTKNFTSFWI